MAARHWTCCAWLGLLALLGCGPAAAPGASGAAPTVARAAATSQPPAVSGAGAAQPARGAAEPTLLKVTDLQITSSAGNYLATELGYFAEEGIQLDYVRGNPADMVPALVSRQVDVGAGGISAGLFNAFARGVPIKVVADHGANLPNASAGGIALRKDLVESGAYRAPADLRGRVVAVSSVGSTGYISLDRFLQSGSLGIEDVEVATLPFPDMISAFENKVIDAASYQEPFTTIALDRGLIVRGPIGFEIIPYQQIGVLLFSERLLDDRPLGLRYMRAYVRGIRAYVKAMQERDPAAFAEVVPILIKYTTVKDRALFEKAIPSGLTPDAMPNVPSMIDQQEWYRQHGYLSQPVNIPDHVDLSFVEQAVRELGSARPQS
jgi:NitT/TauT family transport system substrate-binding protein